MEERTCKCISAYNGFLENHEYQVDVYPLFLCVYLNGGWTDYEFLSNEEFTEHFELI